MAYTSRPKSGVARQAWDEFVKKSPTGKPPEYIAYTRWYLVDFEKFPAWVAYYGTLPAHYVGAKAVYEYIPASELKR